MIDDNDPKFIKFCAWREALLKSIRKDLEQEEAVKTLVELEEALQHFSNKYGLVITVVPTDGSKHMCFTPSEPIKLSEVLMPSEFLEEGE